MNNGKFLFSVIIPVFNTEEFLNECVDSVIGQTIGFDNIQLILINSGSDDGSEDICLAYMEQYPEQVKYVKLEENMGPSKARNAGWDLVDGKYTVFLDSDDCYEAEAFEAAYNFFEEHYDEIDVVACRIKNFDAYGGWHALDYIFHSDRVVNCWDEYNCIKTTIPAFIKSESIRDLRLDETVGHTEDTKFMTELILRKMKYGVLRSAVYMYRRRQSQTSVVQTVKGSAHYYSEVLDNVYVYLMEKSKQLYGSVIPFVQFVVMYSMQWRLLDPLPAWMTQDEADAYLEKMRSIITEIDDYVIFEQKNIFKEHKIFCLKLKYGDEIYSSFKLLKGNFLYNNFSWCTTDNRFILKHWWCGIDKENIRFTGEINFPFPSESYEVYVLDDKNNKHYPVFNKNEERTKLALGKVLNVMRPFVLTIPVGTVSSFGFFIRYKGVDFPLYINADKFSGMSISPPESYYVHRDYIFTRDNTTVFVEKYTKTKIKELRRAYWKGLFKRREKKQILCRLVAAALNRICKRTDAKIYFGNERIV